MQSRFRSQTRRRLPGWLLVLALLGIGIGIFEVVRVIIPFQSENPLWQEVTIGQPVINGWTYGGTDEEGYLKFYNQGSNIVLPPSSHMFDADGQFVVIEHYTPSTLTFAQPVDAVPTGWVLAGLVAIGLCGYLMIRRIRRPHAAFRGRQHFQWAAAPRRVRSWRSRPTRGGPNPAADAPPDGGSSNWLDPLRTSTRGRRFRSSRRSSRWFR